MECEKLKDWWVYIIKTPNGFYYVGYSGKPFTNKRWRKSLYKRTALQPYIEQFGFNNLEKIVIKDGLTEIEAVKLEKYLISLYYVIGRCINKQSSGWSYKNNPQEYKKVWAEEHKEELKKRYKANYQKHKEELKEKRRLYRQSHKEEIKQWRDNFKVKPENLIYNRVHNFNYKHPDKIIETPKEAKQKYLETGYIPSYIKNDDIKEKATSD